MEDGGGEDRGQGREKGDAVVGERKSEGEYDGRRRRPMERDGRWRGTEDGEKLGMGDLEGKREWAQARELEREREGGKGG